VCFFWKGKCLLERERVLAIRLKLETEKFQGEKRFVLPFRSEFMKPLPKKRSIFYRFYCFYYIDPALPLARLSDDKTGKGVNYIVRRITTTF